MAVNTNQEIRHAFPCSQCGLCCQQVRRSNLTTHLDRGDGICQYFDANSNGCTIYDQRPEICRIEKQFIINYADQYSWAEFVDLNLQVCKQLIEDAQDCVHSSRPDSNHYKNLG